MTTSLCLLSQLLLQLITLPGFIVLGIYNCLYDVMCYLWKRKATPKEYKNILITGGNGGLGEALALHYAAPGTFLIITGCNKERLQSVKSSCEKLGAKVEALQLDVSNKQQMELALQEISSQHPFDLVIANTATSTGLLVEHLPTMEEVVQKVLDVNVFGVLNTVYPVLPCMQQRKQGHIAIVSSISAFGLCSSIAYNASKSCVMALGLGLRKQLAPDGVSVSVIAPGFVKTRMADKNQFYMPFLMSAKEAARCVDNGLKNNDAIIGFPYPTYTAAWLLGCLPGEMRDHVLYFVMNTLRRVKNLNDNGDR